MPRGAGMRDIPEVACSSARGSHRKTDWRMTVVIPPDFANLDTRSTDRVCGEDMHGFVCCGVGAYQLYTIQIV